jgi:hypothetical protein
MASASGKGSYRMYDHDASRKARTREQVQSDVFLDAWDFH